MLLSPLNQANLRLHGDSATELATIEHALVPNEVTEVTAYQCSECDALHLDKDDAADCCALETPLHHGSEVGACCPLCESPFATHREAADCCLWQDIPAPVRWRIADAVEAGGTWTDEILKCAGDRRAVR